MLSLADAVVAVGCTRIDGDLLMLVALEEEVEEEEGEEMF